MTAHQPSSPWRALLALAAAVALVVAACGSDDDGTVATGDDGTTTAGDTDTDTATDGDGDGDTDGAGDGNGAAAPVGAETPEEAAEAFILQVGMSSPSFGDFQEGDSRSGEIEVTAFDGAQPVVVLLRQHDDDSWGVLGATTASIQPATPEVDDAVTSPITLTGEAHGFEGTVQVELYADGVDAPIATRFVTGRGDGQLGPYEGELDFTAPDGATGGLLVHWTEGGEDMAPIYLAAIRVSFG